MQGILYIVATPIGNLEDITYRALKTLKGVDYILTERKTTTLKLLSRYKFSKPLITYREDNHDKVVSKVIKDLQSGKNIALVSEAGTPGFSDPGHKLLQKVYASGIKVVGIPGPNSVALAISVLPLKSPKFVFLGFTPYKENKFKNIVAKYIPIINDDKLNLVFFESPQRLLRDLQILNKLSVKYVCLAKELTKLHEKVLCGSPLELINTLKKNPKLLKGEFILVISYQR